MRVGKYNNRKVEIDGHTFDSQAEANYYCYAKKCETMTIIELQPKIYLSKAKILYKPDFKILDSEGTYYVDVKGMETPVFKIKKRLWKHYMKDQLLIVKYDRRSGTFDTTEVVNG